MRGALLGAALLLGAASAQASGLDRDSLLTEAPATPDAGAIRVSSGASAENPGGAAQAGLSGTVMWVPLEHLAADVGVYFQGMNASAGPTARVRYQFLSQGDGPLDLAGGLRFKSVGFDPHSSEVELLLAMGRRAGRFDLALNGVFGVEAGTGGKDVELKGFAGYRLSDALRLGVDSRLQLEVGDGEAAPTPASGSDLDLTAGPAVSWLITSSLQVQGLVGVAKPKKVQQAGPVGELMLSMDF